MSRLTSIFLALVLSGPAVAAEKTKPPPSSEEQLKSEIRRLIGDDFITPDQVPPPRPNVSTTNPAPLPPATTDATRMARARALVVRAGNKVRANNPDGALADFTEAIDLHPTFAAAYYGRSQVLMNRSLWDAALADLDRVIVLEPDRPQGYARRSSVRKSKRDYDGAIADANRALEFGPPNAFVYFTRGGALRMKRDRAGALADYTKAIELNPRYVTAYLERSWVYRDLGKLDEAAADCDEAFRINPRANLALYYRGIVRLLQSRVDDAIADFTAGLEIFPKHPNALVSRSLARRLIGDLPAALADISAAIELQPKMQSYYIARAQIRRLSGDLAGAGADTAHAASLAAALNPTKATQRDRVTILSITPDRVVPGKPVKITVRVRYTLDSVEKGIVYLGFNRSAPTSYGLFNNRKVTRGEGEIEISATIAPVFWPTGEFFKAYVNLSPDPHPKEWNYLAVDSKPLLVD